MRIAYVCADPGVPVFGSKGCSIHVQEFLRALGQEVETTLIAARVENPQPIDLAGVRVVNGKVVSSREAVAREQEALAGNSLFSSLLRQNSPFDIVYERYSLWSYAGMAVARESGAPGILEVNAPLIEEHALHRNLVDRENAECVLRRALGDATSVVAVSAAVAEYLSSFEESRGKVSVHPNGVDDRRFNPRVAPTLPDPDAFTIGFVGSLKPWHGLGPLADAFIEVRKEIATARLLVVGDGPARKELTDRLEASNAMDACTFTGKVAPKDVPGLVASMDVGVVPSLPPAETGDYFSPLKLFEYMAMELPVVCSRSGQMADLIEHGENGLHITPGSVAELTSALMWLFVNRERRLHLGRAARRSVEEKHSWRAVVANILRTVDLPRAKTGAA